MPHESPFTRIDPVREDALYRDLMPVMPELPDGRPRVENYRRYGWTPAEEAALQTGIEGAQGNYGEAGLNLAALVAAVASGKTQKAGKGGKEVTKPAVSKMAPGPQGRFFDLSRLHEVPDVPQTPLPRYEPPRGVPERTADLVSNSKVQKELGKIIDEGAMQGGTRWYNTDPLRLSFVDELGPKEGMAAYRRFMDYVAATSPRSKVPINIRNASYYYTLDRQGKDMPDIGTVNPQPYGHIAQRLHQSNAKGVHETGGWDVMKNPKPASFVENLTGNQMPGTIDAHATNLPAMIAKDPRWLSTGLRVQEGGDWVNLNPRKMLESGEITMDQAVARPPMWAGMPQKNEYGALEKMYADLGKKRGLTTGGAQASAWLRGGDLTGLGSPPEPFMKSFDDRIMHTAQERKQTPAQVLKDLIRGKAPLLSGAIAVPGVVLSNPFGEDDERVEQ
jgi:hypothetical protein